MYAPDARLLNAMVDDPTTVTERRLLAIIDKLADCQLQLESRIVALEGQAWKDTTPKQRMNMIQTANEWRDGEWDRQKCMMHDSCKEIYWPIWVHEERAGV